MSGREKGKKLQLEKHLNLLPTRMMDLQSPTEKSSSQLAMLKLREPGNSSYNFNFSPRNGTEILGRYSFNKLTGRRMEDQTSGKGSKGPEEVDYNLRLMTLKCLHGGFKSS